jgi:hypothetical protein
MSLASHPQLTIAVTPLATTLMHPAVSVAYKRLTAWLNPLDATLTKNPGAYPPSSLSICPLLACVFSARWPVYQLE